MKDKTHHTSHLKLVPLLPPEPPTTTVPRDNTGSRTGQLTLFSDVDPMTVGVVNMAKVSASHFVEIIESMNPRVVADLRPLPEFSIGKLNRRSVFSMFEQHRLLYVDIAGRLGVFSRRDAALNVGIVVQELGRVLAESARQKAFGPLLVLVDDVEIASTSARLFPTMLRPQPKGGWKVQVY